MAVPISKTKVMKFLGMITPLSKYIPNLAHIFESLRVLTHSDQNFIGQKYMTILSVLLRVLRKNHT